MTEILYPTPNNNTAKFIEVNDDKKATGSFPWWLLILVVIGLILIALLLFCTMGKKDKTAVKSKNRAAANQRNDEKAEHDINRDIANQLQARKTREEVPVGMGANMV